MTEVPAPFLFQPDRVSERLKPLPALAARLRPSKEGQESVSFGGWRKSKRQIYKPLANVEGTHGFDDLLERVDHWLARGFGEGAASARPRELALRPRRTGDCRPFRGAWIHYAGP